MYDSTVDALLLGYVIVEAEELEVIDSEQLIFGHERIDKRAEHVEERAYSKSLSHRSHALECRAEKRSVEITYTAVGERAVETVEVGSESDAMLLEHVGSSRDGARAIVAMFHHLAPCAGHHEA